MNKMMLVIRTQYRENYGTSTEPYWKNKGGEEYKVTNVSLNQNLGSEVVSSVAPLIVKDNEYQQVDIIGWSWENDDYLSSFEQSQLDYDGRIDFPEKTIPFEDVPYLLMAKERDDKKFLEEIE
jgi:hypothetical protein